MLTLRRLYLYAVLGVALVPLLRGLTDLLRIVLDRLGDALGARSYVGGSLLREELSWALALAIVGAAIWGVHLVLVRRSLRGPAEAVADERSCASRSTYFFLVLAGTGISLGWYLVGMLQELIASATLGERPWALADSLAGVVVVGSAWALHLHARRFDLRAAPGRTAGDWLTRAYLYGALFVTAVLGCIAGGTVLTIGARIALDLQPAWQSSTWWQEEILMPLSWMLVAAVGWATHWVIVSRLLAAAPPMGDAHRRSRMRSGYFGAVVLASATAILVFVSMGLRHAFAEIVGAWQPTDGSRLIEDIGGPLLMAAPFLTSWWWHLRRSSAEAFAFGSPAHGREIRRAGRLVVAFVGLAGLAAGLAWELQAFLDALGTSARAALYTTSTLRDAATPALATALVGLVMWTPAWALSLRDRARDPGEVAASTARRAYLFLVTGLAVVAVMGSLAFIVFGVTRALLDVGGTDDASWAVGILSVATLVLVYHLWQLRSDVAIAPPTPAAPPVPVTRERVIERLEITAPPGTDFKVLNAAIRTELPEGYELHVLS